MYSSPALNGVREPDRDYYNDLPGKVPPDIGPPPVPPLPVCSATLPNLKHHASSSSVTSSSNNVHSSNKEGQQWTGNWNWLFKLNL